MSSLVPIKFTCEPVFKRALATRQNADGTFFRNDLPAGTASIVTYEDGNHILNFVCPCGCGMACQLAIYIEGQSPHGWKWNGDRQRPTLTPSIAQAGGTCRWHGFLTEGIFHT